MTRVVLDTNVLVSAFLWSGPPSRVFRLAQSGEIQPLVCKETEEELARVLRRPKFRLTEAEEREFWAAHDSVEYLDWQKARTTIFSKLHPSTKSISIRLPESLLAELKTLANKRDVPYQSLIKMFLAQKVNEELQGA